MGEQNQCRKMTRRHYLAASIFGGAAASVMMILGIGSRLGTTSGKPGKPRWQISVEGRVVKEGSFLPGKMEEIHIPVRNGIAHILLDGNRISMHEDNTICEKKICSLMGSICQSGESIICLPNQLVIRVV